MSTSIEWAGETWNPVTGCTKVSPGCKHCYAEKMHHRLTAMGITKYALPFGEVVCHESELPRLNRIKRGSLVFVNSMSDLFHEDVPDDFIGKVLDAMYNHDHTYQVLTKRAERLLSIWGNPPFYYMPPWVKRIWWGVSVEDKKYGVPRIDVLRQMMGANKFLSIEPLLEDLGALDLSGIDWVIVGGESGKNARPMCAEWVESIRLQCLEQNVPFFFKQWGGANKKKSGHLLNGVEYREVPEALRGFFV
jgi:protein gp37